MDIKELFVAYLDTPELDSFLKLREAVIASERYEPYSNEMDSIDTLIQNGSYEEARRKFADAIPNLLLSPRGHLMMAHICEQQGDPDGMKMERFIAAACVEGITLTGDGSAEKPYLVLRTSDEYDVLGFLGKGFAGQSLIHDEQRGRHFDKITCDDDSELWFDITDSYGKLGQTFGISG